MTPTSQFLDAAPDVYDFGGDGIDPLTWQGDGDSVHDFPAPALAVVPRRSLRSHLSGVDLILESLDSLDADGLTEERKLALSEDLISALAGTREKVDNVGRCFALFESMEAGAAAEIARLTARAARYERQRERLTDYVVAAMTASKLKHLAGETSDLKLRANPPRVEIVDVNAITHEWLVYPDAPPPRPDKAGIAKALKAGRKVAGAALVESQRLVRS